MTTATVHSEGDIRVLRALAQRIDPGDAGAYNNLGVVFYQLLTGRFPYDVSGSLPSVIDNILTADPVRPSTIDSQIDEELEATGIAELLRLAEEE